VQNGSQDQLEVVFVDAGEAVLEVGRHSMSLCALMAWQGTDPQIPLKT
jgi:hypothetical protein